MAHTVIVSSIDHKSGLIFDESDKNKHNAVVCLSPLLGPGCCYWNGSVPLDWTAGLSYPTDVIVISSWHGAFGESSEMCVCVISL